MWASISKQAKDCPLGKPLETPTTLPSWAFLPLRSVICLSTLTSFEVIENLHARNLRRIRKRWVSDAQKPIDVPKDEQASRLLVGILSAGLAYRLHRAYIQGVARNLVLDRQATVHLGEKDWDPTALYQTV